MEIFLILALVVVAAFIYFMWKKDANFDVNKDGHVDVQDVKAAAEAAKVEVKAVVAEAKTEAKEVVAKAKKTVAKARTRRVKK
jgi:hypothetical protein